MKQATTIKAIRNNYRKVFRAGYCELQYIMYSAEPQYYNHGVYGWNCDIYVDYMRDIAITTGYRNMAGRDIPLDIVAKYSEIAKNITENQFRKPYNEVRAQLDENRENFYKELDRL